MEIKSVIRHFFSTNLKINLIAQFDLFLNNLKICHFSISQIELTETSFDSFEKGEPK